MRSARTISTEGRPNRIVGAETHRPDHMARCLRNVEGGSGRDVDDGPRVVEPRIGADGRIEVTLKVTRDDRNIRTAAVDVLYELTWCITNVNVSVGLQTDAVRSIEDCREGLDPVATGLQRVALI